jgi:hypothetical protein
VNSSGVEHQFWNFETEYWILILKQESVWDFGCYGDGIIFFMDNDRTITIGVPSIIPSYAHYTPLIIPLTLFTLHVLLLLIFKEKSV